MNPRRPAATLVVALLLAPLSLLISTGSASAASPTVWDRLAMCESSGNWAINTGNGYYGGLQFSNASWKYFGGASYAPRADLASKAQQIDIALNTWVAQGWNAWPGCTKKLGLVDPPPNAPTPVPTPAPTDSYDLTDYRTVVLRKGSTGEAVKALQWKLGVEQAGVFGPKTDAAVRAFQKSEGVTADGIVGPVTWRQLIEN